MKRELIKIRDVETAVIIHNTRVDAVRIKDISKKGLRVFKDNCIGVSGAIGDVPEDVLILKATNNLSTDIAYTFPLETRGTDHRDYSQIKMNAPDVLKIAEEILETLNAEYPDYDFSEKIGFTETVQQMENTEGLDLKYTDSVLDIGLILKEKSSVNLFDGWIQYRGRDFDMASFWQFNKPYLNAYRNKVALPEVDRLPVCFVSFNELEGFLNENLSGERFATGSSIFTGKIGELLFNEKVFIGQSRDSRCTYDSFFDSEGVILENDFFPLVSKGKLESVFTDKRTAEQYGLPHTGAASGAYDGVPKLTGTHLKFKTDTEDLKGVINHQPAIFVVVSAGGDFTPDGQFAAPVQVGFLFDGERFIGKLPEFSIRSSIYKLLGEDYLGTFDNPFYMVEKSQIQLFMMDIVK